MFFPVSFMSKVYFPPDGLIHTPNREAGGRRKDFVFPARKSGFRTANALEAANPKG